MAVSDNLHGGQFKRSNFPQLGGDAEPYHETDRAGNPKFSQAGNPVMKLRFPGNVDLKDPVALRAAVGNMAHSITTASPSAVAAGKAWYPQVNEAVGKGISQRGFLSGSSDRMLSGSGLVAAVSPNMDWDSNNIGAFGELASLKQRHWDSIMSADPQDNSRAGLAGRQKAADAVKGMSISATSLTNIQKAGRIIRGDNPDEVLDRSGAPKTNNFMHNIADPSNPNHVTIDGRAFDTLTNRARPWDTGRGISTSGLKSGVTTRYEDAANVVKQVAGRMSLDPSEAQAISWTHTKYGIEQAGTSKSGRPRVQGPTRTGQPYFDTHTGEPAIHMGSQFRR